MKKFRNRKREDIGKKPRKINIENDTIKCSTEIKMSRLRIRRSQDEGFININILKVQSIYFISILLLFCHTSVICWRWTSATERETINKSN